MTLIAERPNSAPSISRSIPRKAARGGRGPAWVVFGIAAFLLTILAVTGRGYFFDDPFISYQYAQHLAGGHGWTFNIGQHTGNAATSPLYVLVLGVFIKLGFSAHLAACIVFVGGYAGCAAITWQLFAAIGARVAGAVSVAALLTCPWLLVDQGMETPLFLLLTAAACYCYRRDRLVDAGIAVGLLTLVRGDGATLAVVVLAALIARRRRAAAAGYLGGILVVALPWACYALATFGTLLPDTLQSKMAQGRSGLFAHTWLGGWFYTPDEYGFGHWWSYFAILGGFGLCGLAVRPRLARTIWPVLAAAVLYTFSYGLVIRPPGGYAWYYALPLYALALVIGIGGQALVEWAGDRLGRLTPAGVLALGAAAVLFLYVAMSGLGETPAGPPRPGYRAAAAWLRTHSVPSQTVASAEIGILGFESHRTMIDYLGLLNSQDDQALVHRDYVSWLPRYRPDFYMITNRLFYADKMTLHTAAFIRHYRLCYNNREVRIYRRVA